ncbi:MATE family efflux transporter [Fulvivirga sp. M361]|uniref:MATE family efflux transporter n=1 Tax=Fulvivirga sp. M361 TaxID=2594266 RepID=UPI00117AF93C|nr:MATE family efflux transporter [Fulvivirga sp. M361]TRX56279.1 MATE family efflux transporter [Fulvivirga sp. M361]
MQDYKAHLKKNFLLAYPVMISQMGHMLVNVADSVMVGQLGASPLAGASLANVIFHMLLTFGIGVSYAITPLVAAADGEENIERSASVLKHGLLINPIAGVVLFLGVLVGTPALQYLNQPPEVVKQAIPYLNIVTFSLIPLMVFQTFRQFAEGLSFTKQAMVIVITANIANIGLNYILIYGKLGFEPMGLVGAGWASLIARILLALLMFAYIYFHKSFGKYKKGFSIGAYSRSLIRKMLGIGIPAGLQFIFEVGAFGFAVIMIGWIGTKPLAAHQIALNLAAISYMAASGLSAAATIRVGNQLGKKDIPTLRAAAFTLYGMVVTFMIVCAFIFIAGRHFLPALYIADQEVITIASSLVIIAGLFQVSDGVQVVSLGALRGLEDVKTPTILTFIAYWLLALPAGYILAFPMGMGVEGVWYGLLIGLTVVAVVMFMRFNILTKQLNTDRF